MEQLTVDLRIWFEVWRLRLESLLIYPDLPKKSYFIFLFSCRSNVRNMISVFLPIGIFVCFLFLSCPCKGESKSLCNIDHSWELFEIYPDQTMLRATDFAINIGQGTKCVSEMYINNLRFSRQLLFPIIQ